LPRLISWYYDMIDDCAHGSNGNNENNKKETKNSNNEIISYPIYEVHVQSVEAESKVRLQ
jgi:hypothetical protein